MKKIIIILMITTLLGYLFLVKRTVLEVGEEAVIIKKPWFWGEKGVEKKSISTGTIWSVFSTEIKILSLKAFTIDESFNELYTIDNIPLTLNLSLLFKNREGGGAVLFKKFGNSKEWYQNFLRLPLKNSLKMAIKQELYADVVEKSDIVAKIKEDIIFGVKDLLQKQAIPVEILDITFNSIKPPQEVVDIAIKSEIEKEKLDIQNLRVDRERVKAKADRVYMKMMNMSVNEYLKMKKLEIDREKLNIQRLAIENAKDSNGSIKIEIKMEKI